VIALQAGDWRAALDPTLGGSILNLSWRGRPVLRPTPTGADHPLQAACFPLVPYANRIAGGRFGFGGRAFDVGATPGFEPHALHGLGWRGAWTVEATEAATARLAFRHGGGGAWPWAFAAEQRIALSEAGLTVVLTLANTDAEPAPAGVGLHPYLHREAGDRLTLDAPEVWLADETLIPRDRVPAGRLVDWREGAALDGAPFVDNAYEGWDGVARLAHAGWTATLSAPGASRVHVYAPQGADFVCVEPVSHRPDALNAPAGEATGLAVLQPGERLSLTMTVGAG